MPNAIAFLALASYPVVVAVFWAKLRADRALIASILVGYLFLPEPPAVFDLPLAPPFNKHNIPAFVSFIMMLARYGLQGPLLPTSLTGRVLVLGFILSPILTVIGNIDPVFWGEVGLPGLGPKDAAALSVQQFLLLLPFLMARQLLASAEAQHTLLRSLFLGGLAYSLLMLVEVRLSPQLNMWLYGYYQHQFGQSIRFGGYRPVVFLYHGLWVAFFGLMATVAAWGLWRFHKDLNTGRRRFGMLLLAAYLTGVLVLAKSLGALVFLALLVPVVVLLPVRLQVRIAIAIGMLALSYPLLKGLGWVPEQYLLDQANAIDPDRAASLDFRFTNENTLLDRAYLQPLFGWGSWGRNHIIDPFTGHLLTVTDGRWIITIGVYGWVGFTMEFGLILLPLLLIAHEVRLSRKTVSPLVGPLALLLAINLADMIPNATLTPLTWLLVGALTGYAEHLRAVRLGLKGEPVDTGFRWRPVIGDVQAPRTKSQTPR